MTYHPQTNGLVEWLHQMIMQMIRKLGADKKANWPSHLAEIVHAYNATHSAVTGYSPHYLMFRWQPRLQVNFYFPTIGCSVAPTRQASAKCVGKYVASVWERLRNALWEVHVQSMAEASWQKWYYDRKIGTVNLKPCNVVLVKADVLREKARSRTGGKKRPGRWCIRLWQTLPLMKWTNQHEKSCILHWNWLLLIASEVGIPLCIGIHHAWDRCTRPTHASLPPQEVKRRWHHKRIMIGQSPNVLPVRLPWGGLRGSYSFYHGCPL